MANVFYDCCQVADEHLNEFKYERSDKFSCWVCGSINTGTWWNKLEDGHPFRSFMVTGRQIRPTDAKPPWRI